MGLCWQAKLNPVFCLFNLSRHWQREGVAIICQSLDKAVSLSVQPMTFRWDVKLHAGPMEIL